MNIIEKHSTKNENGCWIWNRGKGRDGYGRLKVNKIWHLAHRYSWEIYNHRSPSDMCVIHSCDNPACVNPDHLRLGTKSDNMQDCIKRCRRGKTGGHGKILTQDKANEIRQLNELGMPKRKIAKLFDIETSSVRGIIQRLYWNN